VSCGTLRRPELCCRVGSVLRVMALTLNTRCEYEPVRHRGPRCVDIEARGRPWERSTVISPNGRIDRSEMACYGNPIAIPTQLAVTLRNLVMPAKRGCLRRLDRSMAMQNAPSSGVARLGPFIPAILSAPSRSTVTPFGPEARRFQARNHLARNACRPLAPTRMKYSGRGSGVRLISASFGSGRVTLSGPMLVS